MDKTVCLRDYNRMLGFAENPKLKIEMAIRHAMEGGKNRVKVSLQKRDPETLNRLKQWVTDHHKLHVTIWEIPSRGERYTPPQAVGLKVTWPDVAAEPISHFKGKYAPPPPSGYDPKTGEWNFPPGMGG